jgi:hypothetical protein
MPAEPPGRSWSPDASRRVREKTVLVLEWFPPHARQALLAQKPDPRARVLSES